MITQTFQETCNMLMPQFSVLFDNHTVLCSFSTLRLRATLIHTIRQILVALQTTIGQRQCARMLCVRQLQW